MINLVRKNSIAQQDIKLANKHKKIIFYIGTECKYLNKESLTEDEVIQGINRDLEEKITIKSFGPLIQKNLINNDDGNRLTDDGKDIAREILQEIKEKYDDVGWSQIKEYFDEETESCEGSQLSDEKTEILPVDKGVREFQKLPENIQILISSLSENIKRKKTVSQLTKEFIEILNTDKKIRKILGVKFKLQTTLAILSNRYTPKVVDLEDILHKEPLEKDERKRLEKIAKNNFHSKDLMFLLKRELDEDHVGDSRGKMAVFLAGCSGRLPAKYRNSMALNGDSSVGKTNLMKTVLKHLPKHWFAWGTRFTRATLEDDIEPFYIIAFSEKTQDDPAVIESLKQLTEDGLQTWKHDKDTNKLRDVKFIDRKSTLYTATEKETNEELATRYIVYTVSKSPYKIRNVIESIKINYSDVEKLFEEERREKKPTWITIGLKQLQSFDYILIPLSFIKYVEFNDTYPRCTRDAKKFLNFIATSTWIQQYQRNKYEKNGKKILIADLDDFYWAAFLTNDIFRATISGISKDLENIIETYKGMLDNDKEVKLNTKSEESPSTEEKVRYVRRRELARELCIDIETLKKHLKPLSEKGRLRTRRSGFGGEICVAIIPDKEDAYYFLLKHDYEKLYFVLKSMDEENTDFNLFNDHIKKKFEDIDVSSKNKKILINSKDEEFTKIRMLINNKNTNIPVHKIKQSNEIYSIDEFNDEDF